MQESEYAVMFEERTAKPIDQICILIAVEGDEAQLFKVKRDDYIEQYRSVRDAWRDAHGY